MMLASLRTLRRVFRHFRSFENMRLNQGIAITAINRLNPESSFNDWEFGVFSQWGEDGLIQYLIHNIEVPSRTFVEFGVEDFSEANCRFLLQKDLWRGLIIDGSQEMMDRVRGSQLHWKYPLTVRNAFITSDNIAAIISEAGFGPDLGLLSVDLDGVDYFVLEALGELSPAIIVVEYNGLFGSRRPVSVPYDPGFVRASAHHSNLYWGAGLPAFVHLLEGRGYALVGGNLAGNNAFFVRASLLNERVRAVAVADAIRPAAFSDTRDERGRLTFVRGAMRRELIAHLPLIDVSTGETLVVGDLPLEPALDK